MFFASDNGAPAVPEALAALAEANRSGALGYGNDDWTRRAQQAVREVLEAPQAAVHFVATGTAANSLALATLTPPWGAVFCHDEAHVQMDECGAPEFFTGGAKLIGLPGEAGRIAPDTLRQALAETGGSVHSVQPAALTLTTVTEAGTLYSPAQVAELAGIAHGAGLAVHLDGARLANALAATGAAPADLTWRAGVDALSFGGTKNGLMGVEAIVLFDPGKGRELELRRKRAGHLASKMRYLAAQVPPWLEGGRWLAHAAHANAMAARLAAGLAARGARVLHPVEANMIFAAWPAGTHARLKAAGAVYYDWAPPGPGEEAARLVTSWATTAAEVDALLAAL